MAKGLPKDHVLSGIRWNCKVVIYIDLAKAMSKGLKFYESDNGVILCEGPIPPDCFLKILNYPSLIPFEVDDA